MRARLQLLLPLAAAACVPDAAPIVTETERLNGVPPACPASIYASATPPASSSDTTSYELGLKVALRGNATITGIRFYKAPQNTGTHLGRIWSAAGDLLATTTFTNETASGWQEAAIGPITAAAGTTLVASVTYPNGGFSYSVGALSTRAGDPDGPVYALANGENGPNGVYRVGPGFPAQTYASTSYFVDVVASDATPPSAPAAPSGTAQSGGVVLSWTPGTDGGAAAHRHFVYRNGAQIAALEGAASTYTDAAAPAGATHTYAIRAEDFCGNLSSAASVMVTTPSGGGTTTTVFGDAAPTGFVSGDPAPVSVGVKLQASASGQITAVRFWRDAASADGYTVSVWSTSGTRLAVATGAGGGAIPGWQEVALATPVPVTAGTTYVASYHSNSGRFRYTPRGLASRITAGSLSLLSSAESGGNGVYAYGGSAVYPGSTYDASNYWVDVRFAGGSGGGGTAASIFGSGAPSATMATDTAAVEVGLRFRASAAGTVDAIRFYRQAGGTFSVRLWTADGTLLGSGTGSASSVPGWQEIALSSPVTIAADTTYVASYLAGAGQFSYTLGGLQSAVTSGNLTALASGGVYRYGPSGGFPAQTYQSSNYWVDVRYTSGGGGPTPTPSGATIFGTSAPSATWSTDTTPVELGVRFRASANGRVDGVRFWRQTGGTFDVRLWSATGTLLGSGTGPSSAVPGWQEVALSSPVSITANTPYVASYHAAGGQFPYTPRGLASEVTSGNLTAMTAGLYRFGAGGGFPTQTYDNANYWVDVRYTAGAGGGGPTPSAQMSFFVTSAGNGANGGNYGGLSGADARCQSLATAVGAGSRTWRAYLSTAPIGGAGALVHARDRIGAGPWFNFQGTQVAASVSALHASGIPSSLMLTEQGTAVPSDDHDVVTGTMADGTAWTSFPGNPSAPPPNCRNWTSSSSNDWTYVGHSDWSAPGTAGNPVWNASHETQCDEAGLRSTAGSARLYCFAIN